jgi:hypothetical protein
MIVRSINRAFEGSVLFKEGMLFLCREAGNNFPVYANLLSAQPGKNKHDFDPGGGILSKITGRLNIVNSLPIPWVLIIKSVFYLNKS